MTATIFLMSAVGNKIPRFNDVAGDTGSEGVPMPQIMLAGAIAFLIAGSVSLPVGFSARWGASLLLLFLALATCSSMISKHSKTPQRSSNRWSRS